MIGRTICPMCARFEWTDRGQVCPAFPAGIPAAILHRGFDHREEYEGDRGVRFTPRRGVTDEQVDLMLGGVQ